MIREQIEFEKIAISLGLNTSVSYGVYDNIHTEIALKVWLARAKLSPKQTRNRQKIPRLECKLELASKTV